MIQYELERREQARTILISALKNSIDELLSVQYMHALTDYSSPNYRAKEDFRLKTQLVVSASLINQDITSLKARMEGMFVILRQEMIDDEDVISALEVIEVFCLYLIRVGEIDRAIELLNTMTDGIIVKSPTEISEYSIDMVSAASRMTSMLFERTPMHARVSAAQTLLQVGKEDRAAEMIETVGFEYQWPYWLSMLEHLTRNGDSTKISTLIEKLQLIVQVQTNALDSASDKFKQKRLIKNFQNLIERAQRTVAEIVSSSIVSLEVDRESEIQREVEQLQTLLTLDSEGNQVETHVEILLRKLQRHTLDDKETLKPEQQVEHLCVLVQLFSNKPQYLHLLERCIWGNEDDYGIWDLISFSDPRAQYKLLTIYLQAISFGSESFEKTKAFSHLCSLFPEKKLEIFQMSINFFSGENTTSEAILQFPDIEVAAEIIERLIFIYTMHFGFKDSACWLSLLEKIDDACDPDQFTMVAFLNIISSVEAAADDDQPVQQIHSGGMTLRGPSYEPEKKYQRKLGSLLANLAKVALLRGEWEEFCRLVNDPRISLYFKARVVSETTEWLQKGTSIKFWF